MAGWRREPTLARREPSQEVHSSESAMASSRQMKKNQIRDVMGVVGCHEARYSVHRIGASGKSDSLPEANDSAVVLRVA